MPVHKPQHALPNSGAQILDRRLNAATARRKARSAIKSAPGIVATRRLSVTRNPRIVVDERWSGMYRLRLPDGSLSDMVNLARARDALASLEDARQP